KHAFGKEVEPSYLINKHNTLAFGVKNLGFLAYSEENEPAAFYGVFACQINFNGQIYLAAQSGDTMTHPNHIKKGLFTKLALHTYEYCKKIGVHLVFGFPNQNSYPGFVKRLDWIHFDDFQAYHFRVKTLPWLRIQKLFGLKQTWHDSFCQKILNKYKKGKAFPSSCLAENIPVVDHSAAFYEYKNYEKSYLIELEGVSVWLKTSAMFLQIGDIERCSESSFLKVIESLKKVAFLMGIPHLRFHCSTNSWMDLQLKNRAEKMQINYAIGGVNFTNVIPLEELKFTMADNDTF
ncbi:MAG: GNAT family N-acetyltransferase, partial [Bacteroidetes bacterium]|nr:GNAT family N-acetyltransferase [Bacteroidota bacterium]